jgi:hypothetical protein
VSLKDGKLEVPKAITKIVMEVGANNRNTMDEEYLPKSPTAFLITSEPLLDKFAVLTGRIASGKGADRRYPLGHHHDRGVIFPFAIGPVEKPTLAEFHLSDVDGCSSLLNATSDSFATWCHKVTENRQVPVVPLEKLLELIPDRFTEVEYLKVDAQGYDLEAFKSGGRLLQMIKSVSFETIPDHANPLYFGQPKCSEVIAEMDRLGYDAPQGYPQPGCSQKFNERDLTYTRRPPAVPAP